MAFNATNYLLINREKPDSVVTICKKNNHLWDKIERKREVVAKSDKCPGAKTYAVCEDILDTINDPYFARVLSVVHILDFMRKHRDVNAQVSSETCMLQAGEEV